MNFPRFLENYRRKHNFSSVASQFNAWGGEEALGISLRRWTQIAGGQTPPTEKLLLAVFGKVDASDRKALITAFFESVYHENSEAQELLKYINQFLLPSFETPKKTVWEINPSMFYSDEQLAFLIENPRALRLFKRVLLLDDEPVNMAEASIDKATIKKMVKLELISIKKDVIQPARKRFRLPKYGEHNSRSVALANKFILKHIDAYISYEGSDHQKLSFSNMMVSPTNAQRALDQMESFKDWLLSLHEPEPNAEAHPLVFIGFLKDMRRSEV